MKAQKIKIINSTLDSYWYAGLIGNEYWAEERLIDGVVEKYKKMKQMRGDDYVFMLNVVNSSLANTMEKHYGFKKVGEDSKGNITMTL